MKRKKRIWIWILLLVLAGIAAAVIWQWNNIRTVHAVLTTDPQTASENLSAQSDKEQALLEQYKISVTPPTAKQREDLLMGKVSAEEVKQALGLLPGASGGTSAAEDGQTPSAGNEQTAPGGSSDGIPAAPDEAADAQSLLDECVRSLYAMQADLLEQLSTIRQTALDEWVALDPDARTSARKVSIVSDVLEQCEGLEKQADAEVRALLDSYRAQFEALNEPTDVFDELWNYYGEEKHASRLYFLSQYA